MKIVATSNKCLLHVNHCSAGKQKVAVSAGNRVGSTPSMVQFSLLSVQWNRLDSQVPLLVIKDLQVASGNSESLLHLLVLANTETCTSALSPNTKAHGHDLFRRQICIPRLGQWRVRNGEWSHPPRGSQCVSSQHVPRPEEPAARCCAARWLLPGVRAALP